MAVNLQPTLKGELVTLLPLEQQDFEALYQVAADPLIWELHPAKDRYRREVFEVFFEEALKSGGAFLVRNAQSGEVIGSSRFFRYDAEKSEIEIGWSFLARACWGGAYNQEMKRLMLDYAFTFVNSVLFLVGLQNYRSQRAMEKIGGIREGVSVDYLGQPRLRFRISRSPSSILLK